MIIIMIMTGTFKSKKFFLIFMKGLLTAKYAFNIIQTQPEKGDSVSTKFHSTALKKNLTVNFKRYTTFSLPKLAKLKIGNPEKLPFSIKILLESAIRNFDNYQVTFK